ncbi:MAG: hypothetical protein ACRERU_07430, partial [Methylococcales bacterium]
MAGSVSGIGLAAGKAQAGIERRLARRHLAGGVLVLYDLTSTWVTGRCCELAAHGHSRDGKRDESCDRVRPDLHGAALPGVGGGVPGEYRGLCHG